MPELSVVVPVFNERDNIPPLLAEIATALRGRIDFEIVYVDDGSRDRSWPMLERFAAADARVKAIKLIRNYGEHVAITAGLDHSDADHTLIMACDLQDDPAAIPAIVGAARQSGADLVLTRRLKRMSSSTIWKPFWTLPAPPSPTWSGSASSCGICSVTGPPSTRCGRSASVIIDPPGQQFSPPNSAAKARMPNT